jgi:leader peptidase (prepilin peptidase)/N-methyltransferase
MFPPDSLLEPFALSPVGHAFAFVYGALFGSLANVCIYRWPPSDEYPEGRSIVRPGSHCPVCGRSIRWHDNVPILGWVLLRGRCRDCKTGIAPRYPLVELLMAVLFLAVYHHVMAGAYLYEPLATRALRFMVLAAFVFTLIVIAFIDLDHRLILDKITYPAIPIFYGLGMLLPEQRWYTGLIGAAVGYGLVRAIADGYHWLTGREGLGYGDGKLLAMVGALFGWQGVAASLFLGSLSGSILGIGALVIVRHTHRKQRARAGLGAPAVAAEATTNTAPEATTEATTDTMPDAAVAGGPAPEHTDDRENAPERGPGLDEVPLRHAELPFGPFLVVGAIAYMHTQPWLRLDLIGLVGQ